MCSPEKGWVNGREHAYILHFSPPLPIVSPPLDLLPNIPPLDTTTATRLSSSFRPGQVIPLPHSLALKPSIASGLPALRFPCSRHDLAAREQGDYRSIMDGVSRITELRGEFWCLVGWKIER